MKIKQISREQGNSSYHLHILVKNWYVVWEWNQKLEHFYKLDRLQINKLLLECMPSALLRQSVCLQPSKLFLYKVNLTCDKWLQNV